MIRLARKDDIPILIKFCHNEKIAIPNFELCFVAENENGEIVGFINACVKIQIEPLIANGAIHAKSLYDYLMGYLFAQPIKHVYAYADRENLISQAEKLGFIIKDKNMTILEMELKNGC